MGVACFQVNIMFMCLIFINMLCENMILERMKYEKKVKIEVRPVADHCCGHWDLLSSHVEHACLNVLDLYAQGTERELSPISS